MINRRQLFGTLPISAIAASSAGKAAESGAAPLDGHLITSPPVVQNPRSNSFGVSIAVSAFSTAWVEYGFKEDKLELTAFASHHGLIAADDRALHIRVTHKDPLSVGETIFYRVVAQRLSYVNAYKLNRGEIHTTPVYALRLPDQKAENVRVISINDTHENIDTIRRLHQQIEKLNPDVLVWNGDTCNDFDAKDNPAQVLLNPADDPGLAWAATRPLLFSNGNHDVRGERAREAANCFVGCPESVELPYNQAIRLGPLALITLDTGEDKPDDHPVFAGTANYQPYRENQAAWLQGVLQNPIIAEAPFKVATSHIPLRGLEGQNDGTTLEGYARFSGFGARLWLPLLSDAKCDAIVSGHTHQARHDAPSADVSVHQFVGGGPKPEAASLTVIDASIVEAQATMSIRITNLEGAVWFEQSFTA